VTPLAQRCLAFLQGIDDERPTRARIAHAVKRCERSVKTAIAELVENGWITTTPGGNGTPGTIKVINRLSHEISPVSPVSPELPRIEPKVAPERPAIRAFVKTLEQSSKQLARKPPSSQQQKIPPEFITNEFGRQFLNPDWVRVRDALRRNEERIRRAQYPEQYRNAIVEREAARR
jgi:hypothetical protein